MRRHRNEKPFVCSVCGKGFVINFELSRHMRTVNILFAFYLIFVENIEEKKKHFDYSTLDKSRMLANIVIGVSPISVVASNMKGIFFVIQYAILRLFD